MAGKPIYQDLREAEIAAIAALEPELRDHIELTTAAFNLIPRLVLLTEIQTTPMNLLPLSLHVVVAPPASRK